MSDKNPATCPGIAKFIRPVPEFFPCPFCGGKVEIWSDEDVGVCTNCEKESPRPVKEKSCLDWCEFADKCKGIIDDKKRALG